MSEEQPNMVDVALAVPEAGEVLSLPIGPHLTAEQIDHVCLAIRTFFAALPRPA